MKAITGSFTITAVVDGENAIIYEIVPTNAYCIHNPNETEDNVKGLIEGYLYKIVGTERTPVANTDMEVGYNIPMSTGDTNGIFDVSTNGDGFFTSDTLFDDTYGDDVMGESTAIVARYKVGNEVLAQINVGISQYGMKGERGAPLRVTEWVEGWTYYNGKGANDPYTDVVKYGNYWYLCKTSHRSDSSNKPSGTTGNTEEWEVANQFDMIATKVLLAANAHIDLLGSNTINIIDSSSGNTTAGMSGGDGVQLWGGGEQENANFRVHKNGDVFIKGTIKADNFYHGMRYIQGGYDYEYIRTIETEDVIIIKATGWTDKGEPQSDATVFNDKVYYSNNIILPHPSDVVGKLITIYNRASGNASMKPYLVAAYKEGVNNNNMFGSLEEYYSLAGKHKVVVIAEQVGSDYYWVVLE